MKINNPLRSRVTPALRLSVAALAASLVVTGCSSDGGGERQDLAGVEVGTSKDDYRAALADMDEVTLIAQVAGGPGSNAVKRYEDYFAAVEDWSDGKISFEVNYSDAIVPPTEIDDALVDGRLDVGYVLPVYEPDVYKAGALLAEVTVAGRGFPYTGTMNTTAASNAAFYNTPEMVEEFEGKGIYPLAAQLADGTGHFFCSDPIRSAADLDGLEATVSSQSMAKQYDEMGITAVSLAFSEYFEGVQRGVVDCVTTGGTPAELAGIADAAPNVTMMTEGTFASPAAILAISQTKWDTLPLPAQQLMHDRLDAMFAGGLSGALDAWKNVFASTADKDASISALDPKGAELMSSGADKVLAAVESTDVLDGEKLVADYKADVEKWNTILADDLGLEDPTPEDFAAWLNAGEHDVDAFVERLMADVYEARRPE